MLIIEDAARVTLPTRSVIVGNILRAIRCDFSAPHGFNSCQQFNFAEKKNNVAFCIFTARLGVQTFPWKITRRTPAQIRAISGLDKLFYVCELYRIFLIESCKLLIR